MEIREIRQFSEISGTRRNPSSTEHGKFVKWNNNSSKYDYSFIGEGDIDTEYFNEFVTNIIGDTTDDYLVSITQTQTGSTTSSYWASFTMAESATKYLKLGRLAWLDDFEVPELPGDQKVLFDENDSIGGRTAFKYNYNTNKLNFQGTPLMFNTTGGTEGTYKEGLKYLGNYSFALAGGIESTALGSYNLSGGYKSGYNLGSASLRNTFYGANSGEFAASTSEGVIGIGPYAGRYASENNRFFLDNVDYGSTSAEIAGAFLFADLETERRLYIRNRLSVEAEGKFGDSGLLDAEGEGGMFQMIDEGGGVIKPQYHDGTVWRDFAAGSNHYLQEIVEDGSTEGLWHFKVKDSTGTTTIEDLTLQLPLLSDVDVPVAYTPSYPNITSSDYGYIQISNTSATTNKGFYYKTGFKWDNGLNELNVPGAIKLAQKAQYSASNGNIIYDGTHYYGRLAGVWKQLDNSDFEEITAANIGGATYEWFKQKNSDGELELRTIQGMSIDQILNPYDRITFKYSSDGDAVLVGTTAEKNRLDTVVDAAYLDTAIDRDNNGETLLIRALRPGSNIVLTQTENYIQIDATTGGAATLMDGTNLGTYDWFAQRNGTNLEFFGIDTADSRITITQANGTTTFDNDLALDLEIIGSSYPNTTGLTYHADIYSQVTNGTGVTPTIWIRPLISDTIEITTTLNDEVRLEFNGGSVTNLGAGAEVYVDGSAPTMQFRTLVEDAHITLTEGSNDITFAVDDITLTDLGSNPKFIAQDDSDSFIFNQKGITGTNGVTITSGTNDIDFAIPDIEKFELSSGAFVKSTAYSGTSYTYGTTPSGTLSFKLNHDDVINDGTPSYTARTIAEIQLGGGLKYDAANNVLWNDVALTGPEFTDHYLTSINENSDTNNYIFTFNVTDGLGNIPSGFESPTITIPKASVPTATYTDYAGGTGTKGILKVEEYYSIWPLGNTTPLALDEVTGKLSGNKLLVTYETQNNLHDEDNVGESIETTPGVTLDVNTVRGIARANTGSAYVNGDIAEEFNADDLNIAGILTANSTSATHTIGGFTVQNNQLTGSTASTWKGTTSNVTKITQTAHNIVVTIDDYATGGALYINNTSGRTMFKFDIKTGDLYIKGKLFADGDVEAFTDDTTV